MTTATTATTDLGKTVKDGNSFGYSRVAGSLRLYENIHIFEWSWPWRERCAVLEGVSDNKPYVVVRAIGPTWNLLKDKQLSLRPYSHRGRCPPRNQAGYISAESVSWPQGGGTESYSTSIQPRHPASSLMETTKESSWKSIQMPPLQMIRWTANLHRDTFIFLFRTPVA